MPYDPYPAMYVESPSGGGGGGSGFPIEGDSLIGFAGLATDVSQIRGENDPCVSAETTFPIELLLVEKPAGSTIEWSSDGMDWSSSSTVRFDQGAFSGTVCDYGGQLIVLFIRADQGIPIQVFFSLNADGSDCLCPPEP